MARSRARGFRRSFLLAALLIPGTVAAGFLGTGPGPEILVPYMIKQITIMREALQSANDTLGAVRGLREGIDRIRHYSLSDFADDYVWSDSNVRGLRREWQILQRGGSSASTGLRQLRRQLYRFSSEDRDYREIDQDGFRFRQVNVEEDTVDLGERMIVSQEGRSREYHEAGAEVFEHARFAHSAAEAAKVDAEAQGIRIRQGSDALRLQGQQLRVSQAQLAHASTRERERLVAHLVESAKLAHAFLELEPLR